MKTEHFNTTGAGSSARRQGFTLIEILIVVALIALLIAILVPAIGAARARARKGATQSQLDLIAQALETYAQDFNGYYPPSRLNDAPNPVNEWNSLLTVNARTPSDFNRHSGSMLLAEALMGWMNYPSDGAGPLNPNDGAEPLYGFRKQRYGAVALGPIFGPYMPRSPVVFSMSDAKATPPRSSPAFVDSDGNTIYYYRAMPAMANGQAYKPAKLFGNAGDKVFSNNNAMFNTFDNPPMFGNPVTTLFYPEDPDSLAPSNSRAFRRMLGDLSNNSDNTLRSGDTIQNKNYLLVAPDESGTYFNADNSVNQPR